MRILLFALLALTAVISCKKAEKAKPSFEDFKNETRLSTIAEKVNLFSTISSSDNERVSEEYTILRENLDFLTRKYGKENALAFAIRLLKEAKTPSTGNRVAGGDCCNLNPNGTTNQSCCNFWESVVVAFETLDCSRPYPGAPQSVINEFYHCIQAEVCENC